MVQSQLSVMTLRFAIHGHCLVCKVKQRHWLGGPVFCCVSSFAFVMIFLAKNYNYIFEFVKIISKVLSVHFFPDTLFLRKWYFSMTSQLRHHYVVSCKYWWDILQFFSHTDCQDNSCQKFYKFLGHGVCKRTICTPPWVCLRIIFIHMSNSF